MNETSKPEVASLLRGALGNDIAELSAAQQVVFNLLMAASVAAKAAWNAEDEVASMVAEVEYDAARRVLMTIERRIAELGRA